MINNIEFIEGSRLLPWDEEGWSPPGGRDSLQSTSVARIIDVLCEGEIEGLYETPIEKSIFLGKTAIMDGAGTPHFSGVTAEFKNGLPDQDYITGFPSVETQIAVDTELKSIIGPIRRTVTDVNVDDVIVTIQIPRMSEVTDAGDILKTSVSVIIRVEGSISSETVKTLTITGKCISPYERSYTITNLKQYGVGPWVIELERETADSETVKLQNETNWLSYIEVINEKMIYPNTALVGLTFDSEQFGSAIPSRSYDIKGLKIKVPNNYTVATRNYAGAWTGTFKTEWCDNPAWVYYDILTNSRYGMGFDESKVDKWSLYTIAQYCDTYIDDGYGGTEPRFVCNLVLNKRNDAVHVLNTLATIFRGMPLWASGMATAIQDRPKDTTKLVTAANVIDGNFIYEGSGLRARHTVAKVTWNDPSDFCRSQVECVEDKDGIAKYGWRPVDVYAFGTTSRGQAHRVGKWILETELNETEIVRYKASFDHADVTPGDIIEISDPHYTGGILDRYSGRIVSSTSITVTIDNPITIESGKDYTLAVLLPDGSLDEGVEIINSTGSTSVLEIAESFSTLPQDNSMWMVTVSDLVPRKFRIIASIEEEPNIFNIHGLYYDENKFARVEDGIYFDEIAESAIPTGAILPPTGLAAEEFQYIDGGSRLYGCIFSWEHPEEPRRLYYDVQSRNEEYGVYKREGTTANNSYDIRPVTSGTYDYRVRTVAAGGHSVWAILTEFSISADSTLCSSVENLQVVGGGTTFSGGDCAIEWDDSDCHVFKNYKVEISRIDDSSLRTDYVVNSNYTYTHQMNSFDTNNSPVRDIKFKVSVQNLYDRAGPSVTLVASNPAPSMAGMTPTLTQRYGGITIDWDNITPEDNDMWKYKVYGADSNPPTEVVYQCDPETTYFHWFGLDVGTMYYIQIEPYDYFGPGYKSDIVGEEPVLIPDINVDIELSTSMIMSDSDSNTVETLTKLYDRNKISDGVTYTISGTGKYIQYQYAVEDIFDRVIYYTADANAQVYVAHSTNGSDWSYLCGEADHTLNGEELVTASGISEAETNYLQSTAGTNIAIFPAMTTGRYMRLYMVGNYTTTIYELIFYREIIAEMAAIGNLAALSANMGTLTAGIIQSANYGADEGILIDLDNDDIIIGGSSSPVLSIDSSAGTGNFRGAFTFESSTSGYSEITDTPSELGDINTTEGDKLDGIDEGADVTDYTDPTIANALLENDILTVSRPGGGSRGLSSATGCIKIRLPQSWTSTMLKFAIDVYNYIGERSFTLYISGYTRESTFTWEGESANLIGNTAADNRVRFAHDGTKCCILIGEATSYWHFPKISVKDLQASHSNYTAVQWEDGWEISIESSLSGYDTTQDFSDALIDANTIKNQGALAVQDRTDLDFEDGADQTSTHTAGNTAAVGTVPASVVEGFTHSGDETKIDGGKIYTGSIYAYSIHAGEITADLVGTNKIIASSANLGDACVDTLQIAGTAVTIPMSGYTSGRVVGTPLVVVTLQSFTFNTQGAPCYITCSARSISDKSSFFYPVVFFGVYRDSTLIYNSPTGGHLGTGTGLYSFCYVDKPLDDPPVNHTYKFVVYNTHSSDMTYVWENSMMILAVRR